MRAFGAGGLTLREVEAELERQLKAGGFFRSPRSRYRWTSTRVRRFLSSARLVIVPADRGSLIVQSAAAAGNGSPDPPHANTPPVVRVNLRELQNGALSPNVAL